MAGLASIGMKLSYGSSASNYTDLTNCQSFPSLAGSGDYEQIEVTTCDDQEHKYINGLKSEPEDMEFTFLYDPTQFTTLNALSAEQFWKVTIPTGGSTSKTFTFKGKCKVALDDSGVNEALTYTLTVIKPNTFAWA